MADDFHKFWDEEGYTSKDIALYGHMIKAWNKGIDSGQKTDE